MQVANFTKKAGDKPVVQLGIGLMVVGYAMEYEHLKHDRQTQWH